MMSFYDRILLRKCSVMETINDELKNICELRHTRHRAMHNFVMNLVSIHHQEIGTERRGFDFFSKLNIDHVIFFLPESLSFSGNIP